MPDYPAGGGAADQLDQGEATGEGMDKKPEGREDTFFLPADFPGAENLKPGDPIPLRMVGKTADGQIEVEHAPMSGDGVPEWKSDLKRSVPTTPGGGGIGNEPEM